jgi:hypothetical protein
MDSSQDRRCADDVGLQSNSYVHSFKGSGRGIVEDTMPEVVGKA